MAVMHWQSGPRRAMVAVIMQPGVPAHPAGALLITGPADTALRDVHPRGVLVRHGLPVDDSWPGPGMRRPLRQRRRLFGRGRADTRGKYQALDNQACQDNDNGQPTKHVIPHNPCLTGGRSGN